MTVATVIFGVAIVCVIVALGYGIGFAVQDGERTDNDRLWWATVFLIVAVILGLVGFIASQL